MAAKHEAWPVGQLFAGAIISLSSAFFVSLAAYNAVPAIAELAYYGIESELESFSDTDWLYAALYASGIFFLTTLFAGRFRLRSSTDFYTPFNKRTE